GEDPLEHAKREFEEELGSPIAGSFIPLTPVRQSGGKLVHAFAVKGDLDVTTVKSNEIEIEWPPRSGRRIIIPEIDRAGWFSPETAKEKLNDAQGAFVDELLELLADIN